MSKARELASLGNAYSDGALSNRNLIINGAMQVWQRGTSHTTSGGYSADRWWMASATSVARSTEAPEGFTYSAFITASGGGNDSIGQPIELTTGSSSPMVAGQKVTVSLYAKTVTGTDDIAATINFRDAKYSGTNQSAFGNGDTWTVTTTWQRFTTTFTVPLINPTNVLAGLEIFGIGSSMYITGVQLEVGDTATPFEHRSYGQELALCQRYFERVVATSQIWSHADIGGNHRLALMFKERKRSSPTIASSGWSINTPTEQAGDLDFAAFYTTAGFFRTISGTIISADAEL